MLKHSWGDGLHIIGCQEVTALQQGIGLGRLKNGYGGTWGCSQEHHTALACLLHNVHDILQQRCLGVNLCKEATQLQQFVFGDDGVDTA